MIANPPLFGRPALGERFTAECGPPGAAGRTSAVRLLDEALPDVVARIGRRRGTSAPDVAGTLLFEQFCLRLAAPVIAAAWAPPGEGAVVPRPRPEDIGIRVDEHGGLTGASFTDSYKNGRSVVEALVLDVLEPAAQAVHDRTRAGVRTLRGSMANAVANTFLRLNWLLPEPACLLDDARTALAAIRDGDGLVELAGLTVGHQAWFYSRRSTCCQAFRTEVNSRREQTVCLTCP